MIHGRFHGEVSTLIDQGMRFALPSLLELLNRLLSERQRTGESARGEGEGDEERGRGEEVVKARETKQNRKTKKRDRSEAK